MRRILITAVLASGACGSAAAQQPIESPTEPAAEERVWTENGVVVVRVREPIWCVPSGTAGSDPCYLSRAECVDFAQSAGAPDCTERTVAACFTARRITTGRVAPLCASGMAGCNHARDRVLATGEYSGVRDCFVARHEGE